MKYQQKLHLVLTYIEQNFDDELSLEQLSIIACLSKFHFQRQFTQYFGISTTAYIKALRLKQASYQLAYRNDKKVIDIAFEQNYESSEAFSRAFKQCFELSPTQFRKSPLWLPWQEKLNLLDELRKTMRDKNSRPTENTQKINVEIVTFSAVKVAAYQHRAAPYLLGDSIQKFIAWRKEHKLPPKISRTFNIIYDDPTSTPIDEFRFDLCAELPTSRTLTENFDSVVKENTFMTTLTIPAGRCAKISHQGSDEQLTSIINYLYGEWLETHEYSLRDFPLFFERLSFFPDVSEHKAVTDIYLPIT